MFDWIKRNRLRVLIGVVLFSIIIILIPIIINVMYLSNEGYLTVWDGSDVLMFYGSVLSFTGTILLGGLALWQNERLNGINKKLTEQQYKPILTSTPLIDINDPKEKQYTFFRTLEQNGKGIMINNGYSSKPTYSPHAFIGLVNIGLGPAIDITTYIHKLKSVDGLESLDEIKITNIENFYDRIHFENYEYYEDGDIKSNTEWQIYTDFNLGISEQNNKLNLIFSFKNINEPVHSIIQFQYKNILGNMFKQYIYLCYDNDPSVLPISKIFTVK